MALLGVRPTSYAHDYCALKLTLAVKILLKTSNFGDGTGCRKMAKTKKNQFH